MKAESTMQDTNLTETWRFELTDAPQVRFGLAGLLNPTEATVTRMTRTVHTTRRFSLDLLKISLLAPNRNNIRMRGTWGAPTPTEGDPNEYGHDGHGHIDDLPADLVQIILAACGGITIPEPKEAEK